MMQNFKDTFQILKVEELSKERKIEDVTTSLNGLAVENITELPNEILLEIFGYLSTKDILRNVARVSKKFHKLTQDQFLFRKIEVNTRFWYKGTRSRGETLSKQEIEKYCNDLLEVCKRSQKLTSFKLGWYSNTLGLNVYLQIQTKIVKALTAMDHPFLEEFCLDTPDENALKYLHQCPKLKILHFHFGHRNYSMISKFINDFEHENLEKLYLHGIRLKMDLEKSAFKKFLETIVGNFPNLQYLFLAVWYVMTDEFREICQKVASEKKIKIEISGFNRPEIYQ